MKQNCPVCLTPHDVEMRTETGILRGLPYSVTLPLLLCPRATNGLEYPAGVVEARARALERAWQQMAEEDFLSSGPPGRAVSPP